MSRIPKLLQNISKLAMPTALRAPTLTPIPEKTRKYTDVVQSIPKPGEFIEQNYSPLTSADLQDVADEEEFVLLEKVTKECVLLVCAYNQYLDHFTGEFRDKLEFMDRVQELNELLTLDKPVKKKVTNI